MTRDEMIKTIQQEEIDLAIEYEKSKEKNGGQDGSTESFALNMQHKKVCHLMAMMKIEKVEQTLFSDEELERVPDGDEKRHLIECARDNSKIDVEYLEIMKKYDLFVKEEDKDARRK